MNQPNEIGYLDLNRGHSIDVDSALFDYQNQVTERNPGSEKENKVHKQ